jgi:hypothetical protein
MTTDIIDPSLHDASIPATYTGPGTVVGNTVQSGGDETDVHGYFTSDGNATQVNCGFRPLEVDVFNDTDGIKWEWQYGMATSHSVKFTYTGPTIAIDTNSQIICTDGGAGNWTVTLGATLCGTSKNICFKIEG